MNIDDDFYDPFPRSGLVRDYEPFIRQTHTEFCRKYPRLNRQDLLIEAVRLATMAEAKFRTELRNDFSTLLRHHLKGLHRYAEKHQKWGERLVQLDPGAAEEIVARAATGRVSPKGLEDSHDDDTSNPVADAYSAKAARAAGLTNLRRPEQRKRLHSLYQRAAAALQPSLSVIEGAVLHWMICPAGRTMTKMAADVGISQGYASRLVDKLQPRLQEQV